jgi:hypothetical protein
MQVGKGKYSSRYPLKNFSQELYLMVVFSVSSNIMGEITKSWEKDQYLQTIIQDLQATSGSHPHYT